MTTRRSFLAQAALASVGTVALPSIVRSHSANEEVRLAGIGVGGKGWTDINGAAKHGTVVAYCDVDTGANRRGGYGNAAKQWTAARGYTDWRKLLDKEHANLDGITVSTPDHMHAPVTMTALKLGLATYTQKPLTRTVQESRALTLAAAKAGVSTQMGNQNHSGAGYRTLVKLVQSGVLGKVKAAHAWSNRPIWPQGIDRPKQSDPVPDKLAWDLWLGVADERPFVKGVYHPFNWRGWFDFGAGALGDMGCHIIDPVVWSLELGAPTSVSYLGPKPFEETFPKEETLRYRFPATKHTAGQLDMTWYDGGRMPSAEQPHLPADMKLPNQGAMLIGEQATLVCSHGGMPVVYVEGKEQPSKVRESGLDHYGLWVDGIRLGTTPNSSFAYAGPLTETVLLGVIASRTGEGELMWDAKAMQFTNSKTANQYVRPEYRSGWEVDGLG
jgi:predicted dehydrogenase